MTDADREEVVGNARAVEPLTSQERLFVYIFGFAVALTRLLAVSHSMWDWDEALFVTALHHYDVFHHHPHPPGFPLFFAAAKIVRVFVHDDFHALRAISVLASMFIFPAMFALARSLRCRFRTCVVAALLFAFLPNVWYWGGTAFTDELALVTALAGAALLLRDDRSRWTYIGGCLFFAATMLVRAQNVLLAWPWIVASWRRVRARRGGQVIAGTVLIVVLVLTGYGMAAKLTGFDSYIEATKAHQSYIAHVDGALNPARIPMRFLLQDFLFDPFESRAASTVMFVFSVLALFRPRRAHLDAVLTFEPNFLLAWFLLNPTGISRLSLGYIAANALLAADGMDVVATFIARFLRTDRSVCAAKPSLLDTGESDSATRQVSCGTDTLVCAGTTSRERLATTLQLLFAAVVIGRYVFWLRPGLHDVRRFDSPPVQAIRWIRQNVPRGAKVYMAGGMEPFVEYYLPDYKVVVVADGFDPSKAPAEKDAVYVVDGASPLTQAVNFRRHRKPLWAVFNRRYFEASVLPVTGWIRFGAGWYGDEQNEEGDHWRWMERESHTLLGPINDSINGSISRRAQLGFTVAFPLDSESPPTMTVMLDGKVIDRFMPKKADVERSYVVEPRGDAPDELVLSVDQSFRPARGHPGGDPRDLGLALHRITWKAAK